MRSSARVRHADGHELTINLSELEEALLGATPFDYYFLPKSGQIIMRGLPDGDDEDDEAEITGDEERYLIDRIESRIRFRWMEEFASSVPSIVARDALRNALRHNKPFRGFKDALIEFPDVRAKWFEFESTKAAEEAVIFLENFGFEILEVIRPQTHESVIEEVDPAENVPLTSEEQEWILRGAWHIQAKGGRTQLSLLLKGSKNKSLLKHGLDKSPAYGKLFHLTIEEIENRIDQLIRRGELGTEFFGDLPLIVLTDESWMRIQPWAHEYECREAASADDRTLKQILNDWRNRRREEQDQLIESLVAIERESARRVLQVWHGVAGKAMQGKINAILSKLA